MKTFAATALFALIVSSFATAGETVVLFDGSNLDHWNGKPGGWTIEDGILTRNPKCGYIWTKEAYGDFVLTLEFKVSPGCNSGVFFRSNPKNAVQGGFEVQVLDSHGKPQVDKHDCGALYDAETPKVNAVKKPGEWNTMTITCNGPSIKVQVNGQTTVDISIDDWDTPNKNPDGSKNKFKTALKDLPRTGHIGLQDHGKPVWYRNIKLTKLP